MKPRNPVRAFVVLWWTTGIALFVLSVRTLHMAAGSHRNDPHLALLAGIEAVTAALFLVPRTMRAGAAALLATIGIAFVLHATTHQFRWDLLVYAAAVLFVAVHGPVPQGAPKREAAGRTA